MKFITNIFKKIKEKGLIKDLIYVTIIISISAILFLKKNTPSQDYIEKKAENAILKKQIQEKSEYIEQLADNQEVLKDSIKIFKDQKTKNDEKIKLVYKDIPTKNAVVDALDVQHLEEFFANWDYESDNQ